MCNLNTLPTNSDKDNSIPIKPIIRMKQAYFDRAILFSCSCKSLKYGIMLDSDCFP